MTETITLPRSVVEQALEMLNRINAADDDRDFLTEDEAVCTIMAIDELDAAIRAALERPQGEQEPICWVTGYYGGRCTVAPCNGATVLPVGMALYTRPQPKREPLTDEQIMQAVRHLYQSDYAAGMGFTGDLDVARAIEAAHGIGGGA